MKFAYLCCDFGVPVFGASGSSVHVRETVGALRGLGHVVEVFSPTADCAGSGSSEAGYHPVPLVGVAAEVAHLLAAENINKHGHLAKEWRALIYAEYVQKKLLFALAVYQPDLIYERYALFSYAGANLARQLSIPCILEVNAPLVQEQARYRQLVLRRTAQEIERSVLNRASAVVVVSRPLAEYAQRMGVPPERITVLPNGVNPQRFSPGLSGGPTRARYDLHGGRVIGFVGSLKPWHDIDTLLAAVKLVAAEDASIRLLIVGEGPRTAQLRSLQERYITCTGAVPYHRVPELMEAMDVVVIPYAAAEEVYFSPLKLFEAMAMAKPIVAARVGQIPEVLGHGETGLLYEPGDAEDLAEKIREVLEAPNRGQALGKRAHDWVIGRHTWEQNARRIVALAASVVKGGTTL